MSSKLTCTPSHVVIRSASSDLICEGDGCNACVNQVAAQLKKTVSTIYDFFADTFGLCGIDGTGKLPDFELIKDGKPGSTVWTCFSKGTCLWRFENKYAVQPEAVAHEYMHGVNNGRLRYLNESGAIDESSSDVFAIAFKQWLTGNSQDWSVAGLRDLSNCPGPNFLKRGSEDYGFVHHNSQIPSHAFYCTVVQTRTPAHGVIAQIWFRALKQVNYDETFFGFAIKIIAEARTISNGATIGALVRSWTHVGVFSFAPPRPLNFKRQERIV